MRYGLICAITLGLFTSAFAAPGFADEKPVQLKKADGLDKVEGNCGSCHSLDYIQMNAPFMARAAWDAEVRKMIRVMHAQVADAEVAPIVDYLATRYGAPAP